jgi:hypothetical protein
MLFKSLDLKKSNFIKCPTKIKEIFSSSLTPKGPKVLWCKTTQNYPLLEKESIIIF